MMPLRRFAMMGLLRILPLGWRSQIQRQKTLAYISFLLIRIQDITAVMTTNLNQTMIPTTLLTEQRSVATCDGCSSRSGVGGDFHTSCDPLGQSGTGRPKGYGLPQVEPRICISFGFADDAFEPAYMSRDKYLPFPPLAQRVTLIASQMIAYHERFQ